MKSGFDSHANQGVHTENTSVVAKWQQLHLALDYSAYTWFLCLEEDGEVMDILGSVFILLHTCVMVHLLPVLLSEGKEVKTPVLTKIHTNRALGASCALTQE